MILNDELERLQKEAVMGCCKLLTHQCLEEVSKHCLVLTVQVKQKYYISISRTVTVSCKR